MAGCKIDSEASPQFQKLRERWKTSGYPSIDTDLAEAFSNIQRDTRACHCRGPVPRFADVLKGYLLFKYRQKNSAAKEGASGGWRILALYNPKTHTLYPIIVYPKKAMADADDDSINAAITELLRDTLL